MSFKHVLEKNLTKFGANNSPTLVAMGIATAKGIFRPTFTMMDKEEAFETKRYAAIREGLTELIAIPIYYLSGVLSQHVTEKLAVPKNFMSKDVYTKHMNGDTSEAVADAVKRAEELAKTNFPKIKTTTAFIGVCASALLIIPLVCSIVIKPVMKGIEKKSANKNTTEAGNIKAPEAKTGKVNTFKSIYNYNNYGMKVGGL